MTDWGGAQWLMAFWIGFWSIASLISVAGMVEMPKLKPFRRGYSWWIGQRLADATFVAVLWWGGFW